GEGALYIYNFEAVTQRNEVTQRTFIVEVAVTSVYTNIALGNQNNSGTGSFFTTATGQVYRGAMADSLSGNVDLVFYHSLPGSDALAANGATLAAPSDSTARAAYPRIANWRQQNVIQFKLLGNRPALYNDA